MFLKGRQNAPSHISHFDIYIRNKQEATTNNVLLDALSTDIFFKYFQSSPSFDSKKWIPHDSDCSGEFSFFVFPFAHIAPHCTKIALKLH